MSEGVGVRVRRLKCPRRYTTLLAARVRMGNLEGAKQLLGQAVRDRCTPLRAHVQANVRQPPTQPPLDPLSTPSPPHLHPLLNLSRPPLHPLLTLSRPPHVLYNTPFSGRGVATP
eukprot:610071-Prorocentrum_minimum.AAC.1